MAKQLTIRGVPDDVARRLKILSEERNSSLDTTVLEILQAAVGFEERRKRLVRHATWTKEDQREFERSLAVQRTIDLRQSK